MIVISGKGGNFFVDDSVERVFHSSVRHPAAKGITQAKKIRPAAGDCLKLAADQAGIASRLQNLWHRQDDFKVADGPCRRVIPGVEIWQDSSADLRMTISDLAPIHRRTPR
jgi:hypothetical protein